jgi:VWFA-related protein
MYRIFITYRTAILSSCTTVLSLGLIALSAQGQGIAGPEAADQLFIDSIDVNVVNVEVFVTDRQGKAVHGLTLDDFELFEDRRPIKITNFYAMEAGAPSVPPSRISAESLAAPPLTGTPGRTEIPDEQRLSLILYFDNLFLRPFDRNKVTAEVRRFLAAHVGPEDRVLLATFERSLTIRHPFTTDQRSISDALFDIEELTGYAVQTAASRAKVIQTIDTSRTFLEAEGFVDFHAKEVFNDLKRSVVTLKDLVSSLGGLPGRKALLYVSDGIPMTAGEDLFELLNLRFGSESTGTLLAQRYSARNLFQDLTEAANANRVTLYTLEAAGLKSHSSLNAASRGSATGGSMIEIDLARDFNNREPLQLMALETGGLASFNTNNFSGALARVGSDFRSYYSLGYPSPHSGDGRRHSIEVKVRRKGLKIRHRSNYRDKSSESRLMAGVLATLRYGVEENSLGLELKVDVGEAVGGGNFHVPLTVSVPFSSVTLIPRGAFHYGRLEVVLAVIDEDGNTSTPETVSLPLTIPSADLDEALRQDVVYSASLLMRRGHHRVAVVLRDEMSGGTAMLRQAVTVGR